MSLVHNEKTKLFANALDRASTVCITVGLATPAATYVYQITGAVAASANVVMIGLAVWSVTALGLHTMARWILGGLRDG